MRKWTDWTYEEDNAKFEALEGKFLTYWTAELNEDKFI
jgi:hypothetical protein